MVHCNNKNKSTSEAVAHKVDMDTPKKTCCLPGIKLEKNKFANAPTVLMDKNMVGKTGDPVSPQKKQHDKLIF